ncbi:hypothetical protein ACIRD2_32275 [Streptomyces sp. NPDC093595]|uniref:hypothetical protein n=1 Tax=Streptomyces sp. NPDC093595 TaxID=3366045 RepID=UPI00380BB0CE
MLGASAEDESNKQGDGGTPTGAVSQENLSRLLAREAQVRVDGTWVKPIPDDRYIYVPPQRQKGANVQ